MISCLIAFGHRHLSMELWRVCGGVTEIHWALNGFQCELTLPSTTAAGRWCRCWCHDVFIKTSLLWSLHEGGWRWGKSVICLLISGSGKWPGIVTEVEPFPFNLVRFCIAVVPSWHWYLILLQAFSQVLTRKIELGLSEWVIAHHCRIRIGMNTLENNLRLLIVGKKLCVSAHIHERWQESRIRCFPYCWCWALSFTPTKRTCSTTQPCTDWVHQSSQWQYGGVD